MLDGDKSWGRAGGEGKESSVQDSGLLAVGRVQDSCITYNGQDASERRDRSKNSKKMK